MIEHRNDIWMVQTNLVGTHSHRDRPSPGSGAGAHNASDEGRSSFSSSINHGMVDRSEQVTFNCQVFWLIQEKLLTAVSVTYPGTFQSLREVNIDVQKCIGTMNLSLNAVLGWYLHICDCGHRLLSGVWTYLLFPRQVAQRMAFSPLLTSPPVSILLLPSGVQALPSGAQAPLKMLHLHPVLVLKLRHLRRIPFLFFPSPLPCSFHILLICLTSSLLLLPFFPNYLRCSHPVSLFFFSFVKSPSVPWVLVHRDVRSYRDRISELIVHTNSLCTNGSKSGSKH